MVRAASVRDLKAIWEIEEASYAAPWPKETFFVDITFNADAKYFVAMVDKTHRRIHRRLVQGRASCTSSMSPRTLLLADPAWQSSSSLFLLDLARDLKMESAFLEVRRSNVAAQKLYEGLGFAVTGLQPMYYPDNMEDGLLMTKELRSAHTGD